MSPRMARITRLDGSKYEALDRKYHVEGFPNLLLFKKGDKERPIPYDGETRSTDDMYRFVVKHALAGA